MKSVHMISQIIKFYLFYGILFLIKLVNSNPTDFNNGPICEPIRIELCKTTGYNETSMPNMMNHEFQSDADFTLQTFTPLIQYGCSAQLQFFLCAAYVPMCTPKVPSPIGPCRSLCETVRDRCYPVLQGFGFPWPPSLECSRFPKENNHEHMCMEGPGEPGANIPVRTTELGNPIKNKVTKSCDGLIKSHLFVRISRSGKCTPVCDGDILYNRMEKHISEVWITVWSLAALIIALLAIVSLQLSDTKWDGVLATFITCHTLVTIGWIIRWIAGRTQASCGYEPQVPGILLLLTDGLSNATCTATFLLRYYLGLAAGIWWSVWCLRWHSQVREIRHDPITDLLPTTTTNASAAAHAHLGMGTGGIDSGLSSDAKKKNKMQFNTTVQLLVWGVPAILTVAVLIARVIDADELLGVCYVGNQSDKALRFLVAIPFFCIWTFGSVNLFVGYLVYRREKPAPQSEIVPNGLGAFLFIYCVPKALFLFTIFYEYANRDVWLNAPLPSRDPTVAVKAPAWPFILRAFMELLLGVLAAAWVLGPRITLHCRDKTCKPPPPPVKYSASTYSGRTPSYQTVHLAQTTSVLSFGKVSQSQNRHPHHMKKPKRSYKTSSHTLSMNGNETIL